MSNADQDQAYGQAVAQTSVFYRGSIADNDIGLRFEQFDGMKPAFEYAAKKPAYYDINGQALCVVGLVQADRSYKQTLLNHDLGNSVGLAQFWDGLDQYLSEDSNEKANFDANKQALLAISNQRHSLKDIHHIMFRLVWRLVNRLSKPGDSSEAQKQNAFDQIYKALNQYINQDIASFFSETDMSNEPETIIKKINVHIDKQLPLYDERAKDLAGQVLGERSIALVSREDGISALKYKTAIDMDALESCQVSQLVIHTKGIEQSSESKKISPSATVLREKYKLCEVIGDKSKDKPVPILSQSRNPSFGYVKHLERQHTLADGGVKEAGEHFTVQEQVADYMHGVIKKRQQDMGVIDRSVLAESIDEVGGDEATKAVSQAPSTKPVVYNLLTSLSSQNNQAATAKDIFQAMHAYNKTALNAGGKSNEKPLLYVMNVPVNQWGDQLSLTPYSQGQMLGYNSLAKEAAFFTDLAMLETLSEDLLTEDIRKAVTDIKKIYFEFLSKTEFADTSKQKGFFRNMLGPEIDYFCHSKYWKSAVAKLKEAKQLVGGNIKNTRHCDATNGAQEINQLSEQQKMNKAYVMLHSVAMGDKGFSDQKQYGSIVQGLFAATHDNDNLIGCKSAVDREAFIESLSDCLLGYAAGGAVYEDPGENSDDQMRYQLTLAINLFLDGLEVEGGESVEAFDIKRFAESVHKIRNKFDAYNIGKAAEYNDANDPKSVNGASSWSSPLKLSYLNFSYRFKFKFSHFFPFNGTNELVPGSLASNNQQENASSIQAKKCARKTVDRVYEQHKLSCKQDAQEYKNAWIAKLQKYANSWSPFRHHKVEVRAAIDGLSGLNDANQVDQRLDELKAKTKSLGANKKGALASMFGSFFHYQPVSKVEGSVATETSYAGDSRSVGR